MQTRGNHLHNLSLSGLLSRMCSDLSPISAPAKDVRITLQEKVVNLDFKGDTAVDIEDVSATWAQTANHLPLKQSERKFPCV